MQMGKAEIRGTRESQEGSAFKRKWVRLSNPGRG